MPWAEDAEPVTPRPPEVTPPPADQPVSGKWADEVELPAGAAPVQEKKKPEPEMPSVGSALLEGVGAGFRHAGEGIKTLRGVKVEDEATPSPAAQPFEWSDLTSPIAKGLPKLAYGLGESSPTLAGGLTGGTLGAMTPVPGGALIGGSLGAAGGAALQTLAPYFGEELKKSPQDPDGAWTRALERAGASGVTAGAGWGLFGVGKAMEPLKKIAFQAFGVQPAVSAAGQGAQNVIQDKPVTEGMGEAALHGTIGTAVPMVGHAALGSAFREGSSILANRARDPILSRLGEPPEADPGTVTDRLNRLYTAVKDDLNPLRMADKALAEGRQVTPEESAYIAGRLTRGSTGRAEHFIDFGTFDAITGAKNGDGLKQAIGPAAMNDLEGFRKYLLSKAGIERMDVQGKDTGIPLPEARAYVAGAGAKFAKSFDGWKKYNHNVLKYMVDSGIVGKEDAAAMENKIKNYVPFYRVMDEAQTGITGGTGPGIQGRNPIYGMGESQRKILDPIETTIRNTYAFISLADRNVVWQKLEKLAQNSSIGDQILKKKPVEVRPTHVSAEEVERALRKQGITTSDDPEGFAIFRPNVFRPAPDEVAVFNNGKRTVYKTSPTLAAVANGMDREAMTTLTKFLSVPARTLRAGATLTPEFMGRNLARDQLSAFIFSVMGRGYVPFYDFAKGLGQAFTKGEGYQKWLRDGGANSAMVSIDRNYVENLVRQMKDPSFMGTMSNIAHKPLELLRAMSELVENSTRVGEHMRLTNRGASREAAGFGSREITLDFQRIGSKMRAMNSIVAFMNAQMEGVDRAARSFHEQPLGFMAKVFAGITLPSLYLWNATKDDPRIKEIPRWQKDMFWIIPIDDWQPVSAQDAAKAPPGYTRQNKETGQWEMNKGNIWRVPKPFELGVMFGSVPERIMEAWVHDDPKAYKNLLSSIQSAFLPGFVPQAVSPIVEQFSNRSLFTGRPLVPKYLEGMLNVHEANPYTTDTAKVIGRIVNNTIGRIPLFDDPALASPIIVENYIRAWTGGMGKHVLDLSDAALRGAGIVPTKIQPTLTNADKTFIKAFAVRFPESGANSIQDFYEEYEKRSKIKKSADYLRKSGETEEAAELRSNNALAVSKGIHDAIGHQMKLVRDTYNRKDMNPQEKRDFIDMSYLQAIKMAQIGNKMFEVTEKAHKEKKNEQ